MDNTPLVECGSAQAEKLAQGFCVSGSGQFELFPDLPQEAPKSLGILKKGSLTMKFVAEYFTTGNAAQSVISAGYNCKPSVARSMGHELLTRPDIRAALAKMAEDVRVEALVNKQNVILSILKTRDSADKMHKLREVRECDRLLAQILGLLDGSKIEVNNVLSLGDLKAAHMAASAAEQAGNE